MSAGKRIYEGLRINELSHSGNFVSMLIGLLISSRTKTVRIAKIILGTLIIAGLVFVSGLMIYRYYSQSCMKVSVYNKYAYCEQDSGLLDWVMYSTLALCVPFTILMMINKK